MSPDRSRPPAFVAMSTFTITIRDINQLRVDEASALFSRLSKPGQNMQAELTARYLEPTLGPHEAMTLALIWYNDLLVAWVGTRRFVEKYKGRLINVQTIECFTDPEYRKRGLCALGLQALLTDNRIDRLRPVSVYEPNVVKIATRAGCSCVLLCESEKSPEQPPLVHVDGMGWVHQLPADVCAFTRNR